MANALAAPATKRNTRKVARPEAPAIDRVVATLAPSAPRSQTRLDPGSRGAEAVNAPTR